MEDQVVNKCRAFIFVLNFAALSLLLSSVSFAQISNTVSSVNFGTSVEGQPLSVNVELLPVSNLSSIQIAYRLFDAKTNLNSLIKLLLYIRFNILVRNTST